MNLYSKSKLILISVSVGVYQTSQADSSAVPPLPESLGLSTNLLEVTINLFIVLAAIILFAWIFKRAQGFGQPAAGLMRVSATLPLGPKERILLVEVGDEQLILGASSAGISTLHVLKQRLDLPESQDVHPDSFRQKLTQALRGAKS